MRDGRDTCTRFGRLALAAVLGMLLVAAPSGAAPIVIDFEDQDDSIAFHQAFPSSYQGVTWNNWRHYAPYGSPYFPNGVNAIFAIGDGTGTFTFSDRIFVGAWFSPFTDTLGSIFFELYNDGGWVATSGAITGPVATAGLQFLSSGYGGLVDEVRVRTTDGLSGGGWIMDDVTFDDAQPTTAVPEPSSLSALGLGLIGLARGRRRGQR